MKASLCTLGLFIADLSPQVFGGQIADVQHKKRDPREESEIAEPRSALTRIPSLQELVDTSLEASVSVSNRGDILRRLIYL